MLTTTSNNQLILGEATFGGRSYQAILHYCSDDGSPVKVPAAATSDKTIAVFREQLQQVLDAGVVPRKELLSRVSSVGFLFSGGEAIKYANLSAKTEQAWKAFQTVIAHPEIATTVIQPPRGGPQVELRPVQMALPKRKEPKLTEAEVDYLNEIRKKFQALPPYVLTGHEKALLQRLGFENLSEGKRVVEGKLNIKFLEEHLQLNGIIIRAKALFKNTPYAQESVIELEGDSDNSSTIES